MSSNSPGSPAPRPSAVPPALSRFAAGLTATLVAVSCTSAVPRRETALPAPLQWPAAPAAARVILAGELRGFEPGRSAGAALRNLLFGREGRGVGRFSLPIAIAVAPDGRIAVADPGDRSVHLWTPASKSYRRLSRAGHRSLVSPVAVTFDDRSRLYVADSMGALFAFDERDELRFARVTAGDAPLARPTALAWSPTRGLLYVVDTPSHRIHAFDAEGRLAFSFGRRGAGPGELNFPTHITRSPAGELYVTDALNFRVAIFDESGAPIGTFGRHGDGSGDFAMPKGVAVDRRGVVYVADALFDVVQLFRRNGELLLAVGARGTGEGELWLPAGVFWSETGELYVCDTYNRRVQIFRVVETPSDDAS